MLLAIVESPFISSSTTWRISGTSCWELNWKDTCLLVESILQNAHKKLEGSRRVVRLFKSDMFRVTAQVTGDRKPDSQAGWHQNDVVVLKPCKIEFAECVLSLLKKPGWLVRCSLFVRFLVGCELRKALLEILLSLEVLVFLLTAAEKFLSSEVIRDVLLDQLEEFLDSQM